jgi:hypothetical protein
MKFKNLGVVLFLVMCIVNFSMSNVSAKQHHIGNDNCINVNYDFYDDSSGWCAAKRHVYFESEDKFDLRWYYEWGSTFSKLKFDYNHYDYGHDWGYYSNDMRYKINNGGSVKIRLYVDYAGYSATCYTNWFSIKKGDQFKIQCINNGGYSAQVKVYDKKDIDKVIAWANS